MRYFPQEKKNTCALACIRMFLAYFNLPVPIESELEYLLQESGEGTKLGDALLYLQRSGLRYQLIEENELSINKPILCVRENENLAHTTVIIMLSDENVRIYDPAEGIIEKKLQVENCTFFEIER